MPSINDYRNKFPSLRELDDDSLIERVAQVQGVAREDVIAHMGYKPKSRNPFAVANDTVIETANALAGGVKSVADFVSPGSALSSFIDENIIKPGEANQSNVVKGEKARYRSEMESAEGIGDEIGSTLGYVGRNPLQSLAQAAGSFALPGAAVKGGGLLASLAGAGTKGVARGGLAGGAVAGAALSGGDAAGTAYELVKKAGGTEDEATEAARKASVLPAAIGAAGGVIGAERLLAGAGGFKGGMLSQALKTAGVEGAQEAVEEGVTQYEGQRAAMPYDATIDPMKGVAGAATMGAALGAATGGGVSLLTGGHSQAKVPDVADVLAAPSIDDAIGAATAAISAPAAAALKPRQANAAAADELAMLEPADRAEALSLMQMAERQDVSGNVRRYAQNRLDELLAPVRQIPTGEITEVLDAPLPTGEATELDMGELSDRLGRPSFTQRRMLERGIPAGEAAELIPTGEATEEADAIPAGEATELDPEVIQPTDLLAKDGEPFIAKTGAQAKAYASGGGRVVAIPDHFGDGKPGYVVRPLVQGQPNNTRGPNAGDLPKARNVTQPDVAGTAGLAAGAADGRAPDGVGSGGNLRPPPDVNAGVRPAAPAPEQRSGEVAPAGSGGEPNAALSEAPTKSIMKPGFDSDAWQKERDDRIKASREAGNVHLDKVPAYVETMRGKEVHYVHDPKVRGRILTVDNRGNVYVEWLDKYSQEKEGASPMKMGKREVMQSSLGPRDLKDYVAGKPADAAPAGALTPGATVTLAGKSYTVKDAKPSAVILTRQKEDGGTESRVIKAGTDNWNAIQGGANEVANTTNSGGVAATGIAATSQPAAESDPFAELFGADYATRVATPVVDTEAINASKIKAAVSEARKTAKAAHDDWAGRVYKANKTQVELHGDGPRNDPSMSIGAINEGKRRKAMESYAQELRAMDAVDAVMADPGKARMFVRELNDLRGKAQKAFESGNWPHYKDAGAMFESMFLGDMLKLKGPGGYGNVESNGVSRAVRAALEAKADAQPTASPERTEAPAPPTATQAEPAAAAARPADLEADGVKRDEPWKLTREQAAKDYPGDEYDKMVNRAADLGDITYKEAAKISRINSATRGRHFWAKTRKQVEADNKAAVRAARDERADFNKMKPSEGYAAWRIRANNVKNKAAVESAIKYGNDLLAVHKDRVQEALDEGKDVPAEVLADYPDLKRPTASKAETPVQAPSKSVAEAPAITPKAQAVKEALKADLTTRKGMVKALKKLGYDATDLDAARARIPNWGRVGVKLNTIPFKIDMVVELKNNGWQFSNLESEDPQSISQQEEIAKFKADLAKLTEPPKRAAYTPAPQRATIEPAKDIAVGKNADGDTVYEVKSGYPGYPAGDRYVMRDGRPRFGGNLAVEDAAPSAPDAYAATHKDPGEPAEPVTPAVVREAIKTGVQATDRKPSAMKAELLARVDELMAEASDEELPSINDLDLSKDTARKWMVSNGFKTIEKAQEWLTDKFYERRAEASKRIGYRTVKIEGDGTFTILNTKQALAEFRAKVEKSPGFKDRGTQPSMPAKDNPTVERGSGTPDAAVKAMIDDGDPQAAVDYAAARGLVIADVLKGDKVRLPKVAGLEPTAEPVGEFEAEAAPAPAATVPAAEPALDLKGFTRTPRGNGAFDLSDGNMRVSVEPTERGFYRASFGSSAKSGPRLNEQQAIEWAANIREESKSLQAPVSSREGQMRLANRGSRIASLKAMNDQLRKIAPTEAWADKNIEDAADLDALQDQISSALVAAQRGPAAVNPLRAELEEMSGAELRAIMDRIGLAGTRMVMGERVDALLAEDEAEVRAAIAAAAPESEPAKPTPDLQTEPAPVSQPKPETAEPAGRELSQPETPALTVETIPKTLQISIEDGKDGTKLVNARKAYLAASQRVEKLRALAKCLKGG